MPEHVNARHWTDAAIPSFLIQLVISTIGAILIGVLVVLIVALLIADVRSNPFQGSLMERAVDQPIFRIGADNPYFTGPVVVSFLFGAFSRRFFRTRSALWVWVLPTLVLLVDILTWQSHSSRSRWADVWANYFGSSCGDTECLGELLVTAPFYTSVAYTLGWIASGLSQQRKRTLA
jgi:hypothetical protein